MTPASADAQLRRTPGLRREAASGGTGPVWRRIRRLTRAVSADFGVVGIIVFGSLARDDRSSVSDVDLVVVAECAETFGQIRARFRHLDDGSEGSVTPILFTAGTIAREVRRRPTFAAHLVHEGVVVAETEQFAEIEAVLIDAARATYRQIDHEVADRSAVLDQFGELQRFNGAFVPVLSQLYSLSRSVVIARLLQEGEREYSWRRMFDTLSARRPDLADDLVRLRDLRPYYEHTHGRARLSDEALRVDQADVEAALRSVREVAGVPALG